LAVSRHDSVELTSDATLLGGPTERLCPVGPRDFRTSPILWSPRPPP